MKKLSYIILGFLIGALGTYYFCPRQVDEKVEEMAIVKPKGVISVEEAKALNHNWTEYRKQAVDSAAARQGRAVDHRWTWWSLEDIQNYLKYAEEQSSELGYNMNGVRVYLGVYGKESSEDKASYTTMFMVPTGNKSVSKASSLTLPSPPGNQDVPGGDPLNEGIGGSGGFPN